MAVIPFLRRQTPEELSDAALLELFRSDPGAAWHPFIERYAGLVLATLRYLGFDHDEAMDRFVYVCEKLTEDGCRRLRQVRFTGREGELVPWIRTVVRNLSISWTRSVDGRRRLFKSIEQLPGREQRVFELYFWHGLSPSEVREHLRVERQKEMAFSEVLDALSTVFEHLDANQLWRLASRLARHRVAVTVESPHPETGRVFEPPASAASPEERLLGKEREERVGSALAALPARDRLVLQLRYEEALSLDEVAEIVHVSVSTVKSSVRASLASLRKTV